MFTAKLSALAAAALLALGACGTRATDPDEAESPATNEEAEATTTTTTTTEAPTTTTTAPTTTTIPEAQLLADIQTEVQRTCDEALAENASTGSVRFDQDWSDLTSREGMRSHVEDCLSSRREAMVADAQPVDVDQVIRDPDAVQGDPFVLVAEITQFDAATGLCSFRALWDNERREYNFEYGGDNAIFIAGDGEANCPVLDGIDRNDVVRLWVLGGGSLNYDTQIGGSTTVPAFLVIRAEIIEKL